MDKIKTKKRDKSIDILKAICLLCVILGHCGFPGTQFIYLFHMPLFFMASGYLFDKKKVNSSKNLKTFFLRKIKTLWLPYVIWNTVMLAMQNTFLKINFYTNNIEVLSYSGSSIQDYITLEQFAIKFIKILLFKSGTLFTCAFWFIRVLFVVELCFALLIYVLNKIKLKSSYSKVIVGSVAIVALIIGQYLSVEHIGLMDFSNCFASFTLFWLGTLMKDCRMSFITDKKVSIMLAFIGLMVLNTQGSILLNQNYFTSPIFLICSAICGWIFIYGISKVASETGKIAYVAYEINIAAIDIMALHFIGFKAIAAVQVVTRGLPLYHLARFPVLDGGKGWCLLYFLAGLVFSLLFYKVRNYMGGKIKYKNVCIKS